ncbi:MAG: response regulator [Methylococcales bacterium]
MLENDNSLNKKELAVQPSDEKIAVQGNSSRDIISVDPLLIPLISDELRGLSNELNEVIVRRQMLCADGAILIDVEMEDIFDRLGKISKASEVVGLSGLNRILNVLQFNLTLLTRDHLVIADDEANFLKATPLLIIHYLENINDKGGCTALVQHFQYPFWRQPLPVDEVERLIKLLASPRFVASGNENKKPVVREDVSLNFSDNVDQELRDSLFLELPVLTTNLSAALHRLTNDGNLQDIREARRISHTLKGSANIVGIAGIANFSHYLEEIFEILANGNRLPGENLGKLLIHAGDCLESMSEALIASESPPADAQAVLQKILDWTYSLSEENDFKASTWQPQETTDGGEEFEKDRKENHILGEGIHREESCSSTLRVSASKIDQLLRLAGENRLLTNQMQEQVRSLIEDSFDVREKVKKLNHLISKIEDLIVHKSLGVRCELGAVKSEIDPFEFDQYNELNELAAHLIEVADENRNLSSGIERKIKSLNEILFAQDRIHKENQEAILQSRLVPVQTIVARCQRVVRQAIRSTGKQANLNVTGSGVLVDSEILNQMANILMHLLRNAVDHGIESAGHRKTIGKSPVGRITLEFSRQNRDVKMVCEDDGGGLDYNKIRQTAEKMGMRTATDQLSEEVLNDLLMTSGFTTRSNTTQLSGRGIGMDAVRSQVLAMNGTINVTSKFGQGCRFELIFPSTLVSVSSLLVLCGDQVIAISSRGIKQILYLGEGIAEQAEKDTVFHFDGTEYHAVDLCQLLNMTVKEKPSDHRRSALVTWDEDGESTIILVDKVLENKELLVKSMGRYVPTMGGIVGAAILGDGGVAPVVDVVDLLKTECQRPFKSTENPVRVEVDVRLPLALIVDDSLSTRRSLAQLLRDTGFEVRTAINGVDALAKISEEKPDILLVDMEMPQMDGLELTAHLRQTEEMNTLPIVMITSRSGQKYRDMAHKAGIDRYLTKPYLEDDLLDQLNDVMAAVSCELPA